MDNETSTEEYMDNETSMEGYMDNEKCTWTVDR